jgi:hypothetical protein
MCDATARASGLPTGGSKQKLREYSAETNRRPSNAHATGALCVISALTWRTLATSGHEAKLPPVGAGLLANRLQQRPISE